MADAAQEFLDKQLSKNRFTAKQQERLDASGGPSVAGSGDGVIPGGDAYSKYGKMPGAESTTSTPTSTPFVGGGTERYADYTNSNKGQTAFTDTWQDGAKYQQLRGSGVLTNKDFDAQFASAKGGQDTGTVADDGGGWKLIRQDEGEKTNERKLEYKDVAAQWQAAGYDVRVQDHNPDFEGGTGEIAVRVGQARSTEPEKERTPIEHSDEIKQAKERVRAYEDDVMSGKTSDDIFGSNDFDGDNSNIGESNAVNSSQTKVLDRINSKYQMDLNAGAAGIGTSTSGAQAEAPAKAADSFLTAQKSAIKKDYSFKPSYTYGQK